MVTGFGAATANGIFATAAITGASLLSAFMTPWTDAIQTLSALILITLGIRTLLAAGALKRPDRPAQSGALFPSTLTLALLSPMTILPYLNVATATAGGAIADDRFPYGPWSARRRPDMSV